MTDQYGALPEALNRAKEYIDRLTVNSPVNIPARVVADENQFFSWDNEHRSPADKPYLFDWSYYNGVVMEGLYDVYQAKPDEYAGYLAYVREYIDAMLVEYEDGSVALSRNLAGYVDFHGADCYRTAALLARLMPLDERYQKLAAALYRDLTDENHVNSVGSIIPCDFTEESIGGNYWHSWVGKKPPKYKLWLDGLYMIQPFLARYAAVTSDEAQQDKIVRRFQWVSENLQAPCGLYYHAGNSREDVCAWHWLRAIGWYGMALVDVMEALPKEKAEALIPALERFAEGMLPFQSDEGMWANLVDQPVTETNRLETSGTAMMIYTLLKGVRLGFLDPAVQEAAVRAFLATVRLKLKEGRLTDIYLKASANNTNNYENPDYYLPDEGKGSGPFIMACSEMMYI